MNTELIEMVNEKAPMGRVRGDWWMDELTDIQCFIMEALGKILNAVDTGAKSNCGLITQITDRLHDVEEVLCALLGECVAKKKLIDDAFREERSHVD